MSESLRHDFRRIFGRVILLLLLALLGVNTIFLNQKHASAQSYKPVRIIKDGVEVSADVPPIIMGNRTYVPDAFIPALFGYPVKWDPKVRSVTIGVPEGGIDLARRYPAYKGKAFPKPVKIVDTTYIYGYQLASAEPVRWNLHGIFNTVKFGFGIPNGAKIKQADIIAILDGKIIGQDTVTLDDGLKEFSFDVEDGKVLTLKVSKKEGGVIVNAIGLDVPDEADPDADKSAMSLSMRAKPAAGSKTAAATDTTSDTTADTTSDTTADTTSDTTADTSADTATTIPLKVVLDGVETQSDQPIIIRGNHIYVPVRFISEALKYPIEWDNINRIVSIGAMHVGTDMVNGIPAKNGIKIKLPSVVGGVAYPTGFITGGTTGYSDSYYAIKWENLQKRFQFITFSFGVPDATKLDTAGFSIEVDGMKTLAKKTITKDNGVVEFSFQIKGANSVAIYPYKESGGTIINPRAQ